MIVGGIYRLIDMGNTTVNIMGDMVGTVILADREEVPVSREDPPSGSGTGSHKLAF